VYNFKANKALYLRDSRSSGKQRLALKGPPISIPTSVPISVPISLIDPRPLEEVDTTDIRTDIGTDIETIIERPLPYYAVPIATRGKLSLGHRRMEAARDRRG